MQVIHFTPPAEELQPTHRIRCSHGNCKSSFTNAGNYELHLKQHHKIATPARNADVQRLFYCPHTDCIYNVAHTNARHFTSLKYLRQHYQKVHAEKLEVCERCGKRFATAGQLLSHAEKACGVRFACKECGWDYDSMAALLTHGKRKGHVVRESEPVSVKCAAQVRESKPVSVKCAAQVRSKRSAERTKKNQHQETQTETSGGKRVCPESVQTEPPAATVAPLSTFAAVQTTEDWLSAPCDNGTQTELNAHLTPATITTSTTTDSGTKADPMLETPLLPPSMHMCTQTYDDLFSDSLLGFTDIQTQTNWSALSTATETAQDSDQPYTSIAATCTRCAYDELLVSTETQTSFTQCLLDSRNDGADVEEAGAFGGLYNTQHTQTCDMLLEGLFGSQENDLIGSFQSTYTQT